MVRRALLLLGVLASLAVARPAVAGCRNPCQLSASEVTIEPPLDCVTLKAPAESCDCGLSLTLTNHCVFTIEASDFSFDTCWSSNEDSSLFDHDCTSVAPERSGTLKLRADSVGTTAFSLLLSADGAEHTVRASAEVTSLDDDGCSCKVPASGRATMLHYLLLSLVPAAAFVRRARRLLPARRSPCLTSSRSSVPARQ